MRFSAVLLLAVIFWLPNKSIAQGSAQFSKLHWLKGVWKNTTSRVPDRTSYERWTKLSETEMAGDAIMVKGADTSFREKLKLTIKGGDIYYVADVPMNKEPTWFKITSITDDGFVCEDPTHDFPKKIEYKRTDNRIKATISGNGRSIDFFYERVSG